MRANPKDYRTACDVRKRGWELGKARGLWGWVLKAVHLVSDLTSCVSARFLVQTFTGASQSCGECTAVLLHMPGWLGTSPDSDTSVLVWSYRTVWPSCLHSRMANAAHLPASQVESRPRSACSRACVLDQSDHVHAGTSCVRCIVRQWAPTAPKGSVGRSTSARRERYAARGRTQRSSKLSRSL